MFNFSYDFSDLQSRAERVNYKNHLPRYPKNPTPSTLQGFRKRLSNWIKQLEIIEKERIQPIISTSQNVLNKFLGH